MKQTAKWWSPASALRRLGWTGFAPLSSLADIGEPRIGVMSDAYMRPMLIEACGLAPAALAPLQSSAPNDPLFSRIFWVHVVNSDNSSAASPLAGRYIIDRSRLTFIPDHPLHPGHVYRAVLRVTNDADPVDISSEFVIHREFSWQEETQSTMNRPQGATSVN